MNSVIATIIIVAACIAAAVAAYVLIRRYRRSREIFIKFDTMAGPCRIYTIERKDGLVRVMNIDGIMQSATFLDDDTYCDLAYSYTRDYDVMFQALGEERIHDVLVLGGGGYSYPKHLIAHWPQTKVTCIEIDPMVTAIAHRYFFLDRLFEEYDLDATGRLELVEGDARELLEQEDALYDAIVNDCFTGKTIAAQLATREAAKFYHERLREGGVYLSNVIGAVEGPQSFMLRSMMKTLATEFAHVYVLPGQPASLSECDNNVVIATDGNWRFTGAIELEMWELSNAEVFEDAKIDTVDWQTPVN